MSYKYGVDEVRMFRERENVFGRLRNWPKLKVEHLPRDIIPDVGKIIVDYCDPIAMLVETVTHGKQWYASVYGKKYFCTLPFPTCLYSVDIHPGKVNGCTYDSRFICIDKTENLIVIKYATGVDNKLFYLVTFRNGIEASRYVANGEVIMRYVNGVYVGILRTLT